MTPLLDAIQAATSHRHAALLCLLAGHGCRFDRAAVEHEGRSLVVVMGDADGGLSGGVYIVSAFVGLERCVIDVLTAIREHGEPAPKRLPLSHLPSCSTRRGGVCDCGADQHARAMTSAGRETR